MVRSIPRIDVGFETADGNRFIACDINQLQRCSRLARRLRLRARKAAGRGNSPNEENRGHDAGLSRNGQTTSACGSRAPIELTGS
jgi:hypothetical protein